MSYISCCWYIILINTVCVCSKGKPIMARMKAKPFIHRLPIGPVSALKNGFRLTSPPATVYDPNTAAAAVAYSAAPQRFVYAANGAAMTQPPVPYNAPLHLIVSIDFFPHIY